MANKRSILITGCSDGSLGSSLAVALHDLGWRVIGSARNLSKLGTLKAAGIECVQLDVCNDESVSIAAEQIKKLTGGSLDALVNNAGVGYCTPIIHTDIKHAQAVFELNVFSIIRVTQAFLPLLLKSDHNPFIANNTSGVGLLGCGIPFQGPYSASKAAAAMIAESMRLELAPFGIRAINLVTGAVRSTFFQNSNDAKLPAESIYNIAKDAIEGPMNGNQPGINKVDAETWAKQVAKDITQKRTPHLVYRGTLARTSKIASVLPIGLTDGILKKIAGIDVLEQKLKEQKER